MSCFSLPMTQGSNKVSNCPVHSDAPDSSFNSREPRKKPSVNRTTPRCQFNLVYHQNTIGVPYIGKHDKKFVTLFNLRALGNTLAIKSFFGATSMTLLHIPMTTNCHFRTISSFMDFHYSRPSSRSGKATKWIAFMVHLSPL